MDAVSARLEKLDTEVAELAKVIRELYDKLLNETDDRRRGTLENQITKLEAEKKELIAQRADLQKPLTGGVHKHQSSLIHEGDTDFCGKTKRIFEHGQCVGSGACVGEYQVATAWHCVSKDSNIIGVPQNINELPLRDIYVEGRKMRIIGVHADADLALIEAEQMHGPPLCSQPYELATSQDLWIGRRVCNLSVPQCRDEDNFGDADDLSQQRVPHAAFGQITTLDDKHSGTATYPCYPNSSGGAMIIHTRLLGGIHTRAMYSKPIIADLSPAQAASMTGKKASQKAKQVSLRVDALCAFHAATQKNLAQKGCEGSFVSAELIRWLMTRVGPQPSSKSWKRKVSDMEQTALRFRVKQEPPAESSQRSCLCAPFSGLCL